MKSKRVFDLVFSVMGLLFLAPLFVLIAVAIKLDSPGPVFFRQERVGQHGNPFRIFKFRTMVVDAELQGKRITIGNDQRVTRVGRVLRKYKLDELPQLINVSLGQMSLVGPRPEVPEYVVFYPNEIKEKIFSVPPGITDFASIEFKDESVLLAQADDPGKEYIDNVLPIKLGYYIRYVETRSMLLDMLIILKTLRAIVR